MLNSRERRWAKFTKRMDLKVCKIHILFAIVKTSATSNTLFTNVGTLGGGPLCGVLTLLFPIPGRLDGGIV
jgi:hypothetical protein